MEYNAFEKLVKDNKNKENDLTEKIREGEENLKKVLSKIKNEIQKIKLGNNINYDNSNKKKDFEFNENPFKYTFAKDNNPLIDKEDEYIRQSCDIKKSQEDKDKEYEKSVLSKLQELENSNINSMIESKALSQKKEQSPEIEIIKITNKLLTIKKPLSEDSTKNINNQKKPFKKIKKENPVIASYKVKKIPKHYNNSFDQIKTDEITINSNNNHIKYKTKKKRNNDEENIYKKLNDSDTKRLDMITKEIILNYKKDRNSKKKIIDIKRNSNKNSFNQNTENNNKITEDNKIVKEINYFINSCSSKRTNSCSNRKNKNTNKNKNYQVIKCFANRFNYVNYRDDQDIQFTRVSDNKKVNGSTSQETTNLTTSFTNKLKHFKFPNNINLPTNTDGSSKFKDTSLNQMKNNLYYLNTSKDNKITNAINNSKSNLSLDNKFSEKSNLFRKHNVLCLNDRSNAENTGRLNKFINGEKCLKLKHLPHKKFKITSTRYNNNETDLQQCEELSITLFGSESLHTNNNHNTNINHINTNFIDSASLNNDTIRNFNFNNNNDNNNTINYDNNVNNNDYNANNINNNNFNNYQNENIDSVFNSLISPISHNNNLINYNRNSMSQQNIPLTNDAFQNINFESLDVYNSGNEIDLNPSIMNTYKTNFAINNSESINNEFLSNHSKNVHSGEIQINVDESEAQDMNRYSYSKLFNNTEQCKYPYQEENDIDILSIHHNNNNNICLTVVSNEEEYQKLNKLYPFSIRDKLDQENFDQNLFFYSGFNYKKKFK